MPRGACFELGGAVFVLEPERGAPALPLPPAYLPFAAAAPVAAPAAVLRLTAPQTELPPAQAGTLRWRCDTWRLGRSAGGDWSVEIHVTPADRWIAVAAASAAFDTARLRPLAGRQGAAAPFALNYPCDQVLIVNRLLAFSACVVHACGVIYDGRAYVFCGRSGVGKTTMGRLWRAAGGVLVNDDRVILRRHGSALWMHSTPWHGEEREVQARAAPLAGVFHLSQGRENRIAPLGGAEAAAALVATAVAPFYAPEGIERLLALAEAVADAAPSYRLAFVPDRRAVDLCLKTAAGGGNAAPP